MKKIIGALMLLACAATACAADLWVETQVTRSAGKYESQALGVMSGTVSGPVGYFVLGQIISDGYQQMYAGPTLKVGPVEIGVGVGRETEPNSTRLGSYVLGDIGKVSFVAAYEDGGSGPWHSAKATYKVGSSVGLGAMEQTDFGFGPRIEYDLAKGVRVWSAVARERHTGKTNGKVAVEFTF